MPADHIRGLEYKYWRQTRKQFYLQHQYQYHKVTLTAERSDTAYQAPIHPKLMARCAVISYLDGILAGEPVLVGLVPQDDERSAVLVKGQAAHGPGHLEGGRQDRISKIISDLLAGVRPVTFRTFSSFLFFVYFSFLACAQSCHSGKQSGTFPLSQDS